MKTLHLTLTKKWFDMIASGDKKEEYRADKPYWERRLFARVNDPDQGPMFRKGIDDPKPKFIGYDTVTFKNGYSKDAPTMVLECRGITHGKPRPEWSDNWPEDAIIIQLGEILERPISYPKK